VGSVRPVDTASRYRQALAAYYDFDAERMCETGLRYAMFRESMEQLWWRGGRLHPFNASSISSSDKVHGEARLLGWVPFGRLAMANNLIGILQYLSQIGPVQIEGAFPSFTHETPSIYQLIHTPELDVDTARISLDDPAIESDEVIGKGVFDVPLVWLDGTVERDGAHYALERFDRQFRKTGYALLASKHVKRVVALTPHCKIRLSRLSIDFENPSSHVVTNTRFRLAEDPDAGYLLATSIGLNSGRFPKPLYDKGTVKVYDRAHIESNGNEMAVTMPKARAWSRVKAFMG